MSKKLKIFFFFTKNKILNSLLEIVIKMDIESNYRDEESCGCCGSIKLCIFIDIESCLLKVILRQAIELLAKRQVNFF